MIINDNENYSNDKVQTDSIQSPYISKWNDIYVIRDALNNAISSLIST